VAGCCEYGDEPSGSIKFGEFLDYLMTCWLLRKDSASSSEYFSALSSN
jgi:hypothetical protein